LDGSTLGTSNSLREKLAEWTVNYNVPRSSIGPLLDILKLYHPELPNDARTLLDTPRVVQNVTTLPDGGQYVHIGLKAGIENRLRLHAITLEPCTLELQVNIDGLPLFKSSSTSLWPILCLVKQSQSAPFVVGLYCGKSKPASLHMYFASFVREVLYLIQHGIDFAGTHYDVALHSFVCDAPARAMVKNVKGHSGFHGCEKCHDEGEWHNKMTFLSTDSALQTDEEFAAMSDTDHHLGQSALADLPIGMVSQFPLDYMHLVCLGVMRKLLLVWLKGPLSTRLPSAKVNQISDRLLNLSAHMPREFVRKPRSLNEIMRWKATEFRQFLLYTGPVVLHDILPEQLFQNFLLFCVGITLLVSPRYCQQYCDYAGELLTVCVKNMRTLYGEEMLVYNVHGLIHLANDVQRFGALDNFSAFPFENQLKCIKQLVRKPNFPLQQVTKRLAEKQRFGKQTYTALQSNIETKKEHCIGPLPSDVCSTSVKQYAQLHYNGMVVSVSSGDNCVSLSNSKPCIIRNIITCDDKILLVVEHFQDCSSFFDTPLPSQHLNIYKARLLSGTYVVVSVDDVAGKCVCLPLSRDYCVILPLLHGQL